MSSILKALRKLEQEEAAGARVERPLPEPEEAIAVPGIALRREGPRRAARAAAMAAAAMVLVGAFSWWLARESPPEAMPPVATAPQTAPAPTAIAQPAPRAPVPEAIAPEVAAAIAAARPRVERAPAPPPEPLRYAERDDSPRGPDSASAGFRSVVNRDREEEPRRRPAPRPAPRPIPQAAPEPLPDLALEAQAAPIAPAPEQRRAASTPPAPAPRPAPVAEPAPVAKPRAAPPKLRPAPVQKQIARRRPAPAPAPPPRVIPPPPEVTVVKTFWHPTPARRTAKVRLPGTSQPITVREGERVASLVVSAIEPSAIVFRHEGRTLRRRIGERP